MEITLETLGAFIVGVVIPVVIALLGRESIGKFLMGKQEREDTALSALISLAQESIAGWRESNVAVVNLSTATREHSGRSEKRLDDAAKERLEIKQLADSTDTRLARMDEKFNTLVQLLGDDGE